VAQGPARSAMGCTVPTPLRAPALLAWMQQSAWGLKKWALMMPSKENPRSTAGFYFARSSTKKPPWFGRGRAGQYSPKMLQLTPLAYRRTGLSRCTAASDSGGMEPRFSAFLTIVPVSSGGSTCRWRGVTSVAHAFSRPGDGFVQQRGPRNNLARNAHVQPPQTLRNLTTVSSRGEQRQEEPSQFFSLS
jgi:hypothetical protein